MAHTTSDHSISRKQHEHRHRHTKASSVIIHVKIRHLPNDHQNYSTHTIVSKQHIHKKQIISSSSLDFVQSIQKTTSNPTSILWANSTDYRIKHENNPNRRKHQKMKQKCKIAVFIGVLILIILLLTILLCLLLISTSKDRLNNQNANVTLRWNITGITVAGTTNVVGNGSNQLYNPWGLVLTYENTLYVADRYNHRVQKYLRGSSNGTTAAGQANSTTCSSYQCLRTPSSIVLDDNENLLISEEVNHRVVLWKKNPTVGQLAAGTGFGSGNNQFLFPYGIARDSQSGALYVSDNGNHRIMRYAEGNNTGVLVAGGNGRGNNTNQLNSPMGIYFESLSNSLIIANMGAHNIIRWRISDSSWTLVAGNLNATRGKSPSSLSGPYGSTVDPMGNMYVVDSSNHRIQFFSVGQTEGRTIAGITGVSGFNSTLLKESYSVTFDNQLNVYVADTWNNRVQKFLRY